MENGFIGKYRQSGNNKEILVRLTPRGRKAYYTHEKYHKNAVNRIILDVEGMDSDQTVLLLRFLGMVEESIDRCINEKDLPAGEFFEVSS